MRKVLLFASVMLSVVILLSGCWKKENSDSVMNRQTEELLAEANRQVGLPAITNFQEKKILKAIYELRDREDLICYAYLYNAMTGKVGQYLGKCIGYGIPYCTQFSNPEKFQGVTTKKVAVDGVRDWEYAYEVMPQAEPNGLFMPATLSATWLLLIDPSTGNPRPVYIEPEILVSPFPLEHEE